MVGVTYPQESAGKCVHFLQNSTLYDSRMTDWFKLFARGEEQ